MFLKDLTIEANQGHKCVYFGTWKQGSKEKHGQGYLITQEGDFYQGDITNGKYHGYGRLIYAKNDDYNIMYEGEWNHGERTNGTLIMNNFEWKYNGPFLKDKPHGEGEVTIKGLTKKFKLFGGVNFGKSENQEEKSFEGRKYFETFKGLQVGDQFFGDGIYRNSFGEIKSGDLTEGVIQIHLPDGPYFVGVHNDQAENGLGIYCYPA